MATIAGVTGSQHLPGTKGYRDQKYQYASSSHEQDHGMKPGLIIEPENKNDIVLALKYAKAQKIAVAIRTGGHQYSGASSTLAPNIQLDLEKLSEGRKTEPFLKRMEEALSVRASAGAWAHSMHISPRTTCRSFGLFGDHVISLEIVDHEGNFKEITKATDPDMFYALLGGSPGNLGVLTHFTIEVHRDNDFVGSRGMKALYWYKPETLKRLLDILVAMSDDENFPPNFDLCVSVLSSSFKLLDLWPDLDGKMRREHPEIYGENGIPFWPRTIIVYAQWVPFSKNAVCDMSFFDKLRPHSLSIKGVEEKPMSELTGEWIFRNTREFEHPYVKRTYTTNSTTLGKDGWTDWVAKRIDAVVTPEHNRCWLAAQLQCFGGKHSKFRTNADNGTSYSWRDSTLVATLDCFHEDSTKTRAEDWEKVNDEEGIGPNGLFSKRDRRMLWGSYGEYDLDKVWDTYYEDRAKYERLGRIRQRADPDGIFTPNTFCVKRLEDFPSASVVEAATHLRETKIA
ncbi:MAG: hypothetical protein Q9201_004193 [Fulgogasparrea decipioides]